jgi:glycosyltransferase involved in cell wall biosynthesis
VHGDTKRSLAHHATLGILPSIRQEPQSLALLELLCGGVPVIASNVGGNPDMIQPGVNGDLFSAGDASELAAKIDGLLSRPNELARLAAAARPSVEAFRWDRIAGQYLELFREVLRKSKQTCAA